LKFLILISLFLSSAAYSQFVPIRVDNHAPKVETSSEGFSGKWRGKCQVDGSEEYIGQVVISQFFRFSVVLNSEVFNLSEQVFMTRVIGPSSFYYPRWAYITTSYFGRADDFVLSIAGHYNYFKTKTDTQPSENRNVSLRAELDGEMLKYFYSSVPGESGSCVMHRID